MNPGAVFKAGSVIKAKRHQNQSPIIRADIEDEFPRDFAIFDLKKFLLMFSILKDPDVSFDEDRVVFRDKSGKTAQIKYASPNVIDHIDYGIDVVMPSVDLKLDLTEGNLKNIQSACSGFAAPEFAFIGDGKTVRLSTYNTQNPKSTDSFAIDVGETDRKFTIILSAEYLTSILIRDYTVSVSFRGLIQFTSDTVTYWVTASDKSKVS